MPRFSDKTSFLRKQNGQLIAIKVACRISSGWVKPNSVCPSLTRSLRHNPEDHE